MKINLTKIKEVAEKNPMALTTILYGGGRPNVIGIAYVKVLDKSTLLITDNFMGQTIKDIEENNNVALVVWGKNWSGYKIVGKAKYYSKGKWVNLCKSMKENKGLPAKGAIIIKVSKIISSH